MQVLDPLHYSAVSGGGARETVEAAVVTWLAEKALNLTYDNLQTLTNYMYNSQLPVTDTTMFNAMGDFNIVPQAADNDG